MTIFAKENQKSKDEKYLDELKAVQLPSLIFVMGCQRSGTTFLYQMLASTGKFKYISAYEVIKYDELIHNHKTRCESEIKDQLQQKINAAGITNRGIDQIKASIDAAEEYGFILPRTKKTSSAALRLGVPQLIPENLNLFLELCRKKQFLLPDSRPLLLKNPDDFFCNFMYMHEQFPKAKMIFIHRHPLKTLDSSIKAWRHVLENKNLYLELTHQRNRPPNSLNDKNLIAKRKKILESEEGIRNIFSKNIEAYQYYVDNIEKLPSEYFISLRYEDLCLYPDEQFAKIRDFLNIDFVFDEVQSAVSVRKNTPLPEVEKIYESSLESLKPYLQYMGYGEFPF